MEFIPAQPSAFHRYFFAYYAKWLLRSRFKSVHINQEYFPAPTARTVYFLNHRMWWDGLIPHLLNHFLMKQKGYAMMELKQMKTYSFFKKLGAFSIDISNAASVRKSLTYTLSLLKKERHSVYIFPEGKILPPGTETKDFEPGIGWLSAQNPSVDFVPVALHPEFAHSSKPQLFISIGNPVLHLSTERKRNQKMLENALTKLLSKTIEDAGNNRIKNYQVSL